MLCCNLPIQIKEYIEYSRGLSFSQEPDYHFINSLFQECMIQNNVEVDIPDFIWHKNWLSLEKQIIKQQMLKVI
jgi:hypothetical protein